MGEVIRHEQCPRCAEEGRDNAGDNLGIYPNGSYCFACGYTAWSDPGGRSDVCPDEDTGTPTWKPVKGQHEALPDRGISEAIARLYDYTSSEVKGTPIQIANYRDPEGRLVAQKIRGPNKQFVWKGDARKAGLYGEHLWKRGGRRLIICEGEVDCLAVAQVLGGKWPVVSLRNGAGEQALTDIKKSFDFVNSYESVLFCFDMDDTGQKAAVDGAQILTPGKAKLVQLPRNDAAEMVAHGESRILSTALWEARQYVPQGIMSVAEVFARPRQRRRVYPFPWPEMNKKLYGQAEGNMIMIASGTGMGKSTFVRTLAHDHLKNKHKIGMLMLEESPIETIQEIMSFEAGIPINQIMTARWLNEALVDMGREPVEFDIVDNLSDEVYDELKKGLLEKNNLYMYDTDGKHKNILAQIEYMAQALDCKVIILDHITLVVATMGEEGSERQSIDRLLAELRGVVDRTGIVLLVVCQLRKSDGRPYEEGGRVTLQDLRGSGMLSMVPNSVLACERDQQHPDEHQRNTLLIRSLKHRLSGYTGPVMALRWDQSTHRFEPAEYVFDEAGEIKFGATSALDPMEIPDES